MRVLLDEQLPVDLAAELACHTADIAPPREFRPEPLWTLGDGPYDDGRASGSDSCVPGACKA
jgi:hypothetical protein